MDESMRKALLSAQGMASSIIEKAKAESANIEKAAQEKASLLGINDSFKKVVLVRDVVKPLRDERGVVTMSVFDFLLDENSLAGI